MKRTFSQTPYFPRLEDSGFWGRCSRRRGTLLFLLFLLFCGVLTGAFLPLFWELFQNRELLPLFFSGIPQGGAGFSASFSTFLLNLLIFLIASFLLGITAFGAFAIPLLVLLKGMSVGLGVCSFLWMDGLWGLGRSALSYTPAAAASLLLLLLFSLRALAFSDRLRQVSFSPCEGNLNFREYCKDFLLFLCLAVAVSLLGGGLSTLSSVLFP